MFLFVFPYFSSYSTTPQIHFLYDTILAASSDVYKTIFNPYSIILVYHKIKITASIFALTVKSSCPEIIAINTHFVILLVIKKHRTSKFPNIQCLLLSQKGFEPPAFPLGEPPDTRFQPVSIIKKSLYNAGFQPFSCS